MVSSLFEAAIPLVCCFLEFYPDIYSICMVCKSWRDIIYLQLAEVCFRETVEVKQYRIFCSHNFRQLYKLHLVHIFDMNQCFFRSVYYMTRIKEVSFQNCTGSIFSGGLSSHNLVKVSFTACFQLRDSDISEVQSCCPQLRWLLVIQSFFITQPSVFMGSISHPSVLEHLTIKSCPNFIKVRIPPELPEIRSILVLNLSESKIDSQQVEELCKVFTSLKELILIQCLSCVGEICVSSASLVRLELGLCSRLTGLSLKTPLLELIELSLCSSLKKISFCCSFVNLKELNVALLNQLEEIDLGSSCIHEQLQLIHFCGCSSFAYFNYESVRLKLEAHQRRLRIEVPLPSSEEEYFQENSYQYLFYRKYLTKEEKARLPPRLIPLVNFLLHVGESCPNFRWDLFLKYSIGANILLENKSFLQPIFLKLLAR
jgi:hypothetical protein